MSSSTSGVLESSIKKLNSRSSSNDDEICDDWEQLDQQKIEKSLKSIKMNSAFGNKSDEEDDKNFIDSNNANLAPIPILNNPFPQAAIKILKRPASDKKLNEMGSIAQAGNTTQSIKTFEQREQEYAQARLRILGSAHPENVQSTISTQPSNTKTSTNSSNISNHNQMNRQNLNLIRDPNGPDGSRGFKNYSK
ncbi:SUZ domain-containing 1 isoform X1 [Brachionus plicatilis]|uniref:SUZ RNA-binding domain-containing n=1 Tax=Brachionus plicatilis TaxID=10195 RepID=A0A3M7STJ7_BRAPC|nr:SUZ domain-containing 1 isoform X1 [Brachionus plicatilis]